MNNILIIISFVIWYNITTAQAQEQGYALEERKGHKNQCYTKRFNKSTRYFYVDTQVSDVDPCATYFCKRESGVLVVYRTGCGYIGDDHNCTIIEERRPHPYCCPKLVC